MSVLTQRFFVVRFKDLIRWDTMFYRRVEWQWPVRVMKPIATALKRKSVEVDPNADRAALPIIEKISFGGAVSVSAPRDRIGYKGRLFWANKGDYIYSKIRVKQGSSAIVPDSVEALAVSPEYPVYEVDQRTAVSGYFELVIRSRPFLRLLDGLSHGGSTKTRIPPQQFEQLVIPLPPLETQRAILAEWRKAKAEIAAAQERITKLEAENRETFLTSLGIQPESARPRLKCFVSWWRELERWSVEFVTRKRLGLGQSEAGTYPPRPLGVLCVGISGSTPSTKDLRFWNGTIPWVSPKDMKTEVVTDAQDHISEIAIEEAGAPLIEAPAVLVVMRSGILQRMVPVALLAKNASINQDLRAYRVRDTTTLMPEFLAAYLQNRQDDLLRLVKWSTTVQSMNKEELDRFPIPLPPIDVQRRIMERVEAGRARIAHEREVARETARRIEADLEAWLLGTKEVGS